MKSNLKYALAFLGGSALFSGCDPTIESPSLKPGTANFSRYVAVGNSLTAGYADGGLYLEGQKVAWPVLVAQQMKSVGGGEFEMPYLNESAPNGSGYKILTGFDATGSPIIGDVAPGADVVGSVAGLTPDFGTNKYVVKTTGQLWPNNMGVPGLFVDNVDKTGFGLFQGYFARLVPADKLPTTSYLSAVGQSNATFFTCWLGNNDVLFNALKGGTVPEITGDGPFRANYSRLLDSLSKGGAKGVVANIPNVTSAPHFTTVSYARLSAAISLSAPQVAALKASYAPLNAGIKEYNLATGQNIDTVNFREGAPNAPMIADKTHPFGMRPMNAKDLAVLTLPTDSIKAGWGTAKPIPDSCVITSTELANINARTIALNAIIKDEATKRNIPLFDANNFLETQIKPGAYFDGILVNAGFVSGGAFSLDGIHLTPRGNAIVANEFIKTINKSYNASIPLVNVGAYGGVKFP